LDPSGESIFVDGPDQEPDTRLSWEARASRRVLGQGLLVAVIAPNPTPIFDLSAMAFRFDPPPLGGSGGHRRPSRRLLVESGLDEFSESLSRHFPISLSTPMPVAMDDQHALTRKPGAQASEEACLGIRTDALGFP